MENIVIGIDLGTTNSAAAFINKYGKPEMIKNAEGESIVPSVILFTDDQTYVGTLAKKSSVIEKDRVANYFKIEMGNYFYSRYFNGHEYSAEDLSTIVLLHIKENCTHYLGRSVDRVVITVPAYFTDVQRKATIAAGKKAGLDVLRIINEPTAAALAFGMKSNVDEKILIYDLGGGTFDITLARVDTQGIYVLATDGDHYLGGKNWDDMLIDYVAGFFNSKYNINLTDNILTYHDLLTKVEDAKKVLSIRQKATIFCNYEGVVENIEVSRDLFNTLSKDLLDRTLSLVDNVLREKNMEWQNIDRVLMVGGSTRMPMVGEALHKLWGKKPDISLNPDECVAMGAAIQGAIELSQNNLVPKSSPVFTLGSSKISKDVNSHSLGMVMVSNDNSRFINSIVIPKNTTIPVEKVKTGLLNTRQYKSNTLEVFLLQGESESPTDTMPLGRYVFSNVPYYSGGTVVDVKYCYNISGVVEVNAYDRKSGANLEMTVDDKDVDLSWTMESPNSKKVEDKNLKIFLLLDCSSSMNGKPFAEMKRAACAFLDEIDFSCTEIGIISFGSNAKLELGFSDEPNKLVSIINKIAIRGTTPMAEAIQIAHDRMIFLQDIKIIVLFTDGIPDDQNEVVRYVEKCKMSSIEIMTIGTLGANEKFLKSIATSEDRSIYTSLDNLTSAFSSIAREIVITSEITKKGFALPRWD